MAVIAPHGGKLVNRMAGDRERDALVREARQLPAIPLDEWEVSDVELIGIGGYSPLEGLMTRAEYESVLESMRLPGGLAWTIPVTVAVQPQQADRVKPGQRVALLDDQRQPVAVLDVTDRWTRDRQREAQVVYGTVDPSHPGVARTLSASETLIGGAITVLHHTNQSEFAQYRLEPKQTRQLFEQRGWSLVVGFQTRNPVHRAHEYLIKTALEMADGLLLHPLVGQTRKEDIPADVRMRCYEVLLEGYFPKDRVVLAVNPAAMRYGGPKEAIFHAIVRLNYGCSHFIVGRDHAGVGSFYGPLDAQQIFRRFDRTALAITPLCFDNSFFCKRCGGMASEKTCPHPASERVNLSGTAVRQMLRDGQVPPPEFSRPEVAKVLIEAFRQQVGAAA